MSSEALNIVRSRAWRKFANHQLTAQVACLQQGDHLCLVYEDDPAEQLAALLPFLEQGLNNGERCVYVADDQTTTELRLAMEDYGLDVDGAVEHGALVLWTRMEWRQAGKLDSAAKEAQVRGVIQEALQAGFSGIRFCVEMTWTLGPDIGVEDLRHWEATINTIFTPEVPARIICQYSRRRLHAGVIDAGLRTHPLAILPAGIFQNQHYDAPAILRGEASAQSVSSPQVAAMLALLQAPGD